MNPITTIGEEKASYSLRAVQRPQGEAVFSGELHTDIVDVVRFKLRWNLRRYPFLRSVTDEMDDAVAVGVAAIWVAIFERSLDWSSLSRIEKLELATPAVSHLQRVARTRRTSRRDAVRHGGFRNRYLYENEMTDHDDGSVSESWLNSAAFACRSAEDEYLAVDYEAVDFTDEVVNTLFGTPGEKWTPTQLRVIEALAYHRGSSVDMGRMLFGDHGGKSKPENLFTSHKQVIQRKIARHRAREAS